MNRVVQATRRAFSATLAAPFVCAAPRRPNIVVFVTDDESWLERGIYGWSGLSTPHFERVAREGILFTHGYTSAPSCAPSRASLLTGRNFWELEEGAFIQAWLPAKFAVLPDLTEAGGYAVGFTGKGWGPGVMEHSGRTRNPAGPAYNSIRSRARQPGINEIDYAANFESFLERWPPGKPFWFWVGPTEPHEPYGPDNHRKLDRYGVLPEQVKTPGFLPDTPGVRRGRANFVYEVCHADETLGKILNVLERRNELDNTLLIVTADNGTSLPHSKTTAYDWGVRVPLAMMWPGRIDSGRRTDAIVNFIDLAPTMLQAAGLPVPKEMSGRSLFDVVGGKPSNREWTAFGLEWHGEFDPVSFAARAIRDRRWHCIVNYGAGPRIPLDPAKRLPDDRYETTAANGSLFELLEKHAANPSVQPFVRLLADPRSPVELYDCEADPWQMRNLAGRKEYAEVEARLRGQLEAYQRRTRDPRITGDMATFERTRKFVQERKRAGYSG
jgi:uncharacterized sulfatase